MKNELLQIKERIQLMGYKKKFLASKIGVDPVTFSYFINGKRKLSDNKVIDLKRYLGI
jgi:plasmid maintenance system antidote protein VapI